MTGLLQELEQEEREGGKRHQTVAIRGGLTLDRGLMAGVTLDTGTVNSKTQHDHGRIGDPRGAEGHKERG